jgi:flavin-dependent thymidylate synthase
MKISLISYTPNADEILIFSKRTRLNMGAEDFKKVSELSEKEKEKELGHVFTTVTSSWEFVDYIFLIEGVTRAFTHQLVRHRVGFSFAQQSQRTVDMSGFQYSSFGKAKDNETYHRTMQVIMDNYLTMIKDGVSVEDARGVLPTNIHTNILVKTNLRSLSNLFSERLCIRTQKEFRMVCKEMKRLVKEVHPWIPEEALSVYCIKNKMCFFPRFTGCKLKNENNFTKEAAEELL